MSMSTLIPSTITESDDLFLTASDFEPCCTTRSEDCDKPAEWFTIAGCCGDDLLKCNKHFEENKAYFAGGSSFESRCIACGKHFPVGTTLSERFPVVQRIK